MRNNVNTVTKRGTRERRAEAGYISTTASTEALMRGQVDDAFRQIIDPVAQERIGLVQLLLESFLAYGQQFASVFRDGRGAALGSGHQRVHAEHLAWLQLRQRALLSGPEPD